MNEARTTNLHSNEQFRHERKFLHFVTGSGNRLSTPQAASRCKLLIKSPQRIAVVRALGGLGDFLCVIPAVRSLRAALPQATLTLIGLAAVRPLVKRFGHYLDDLIVLPGYPGLPEQPLQLEQIPAFLELAQKQQFDLALQMQGNGTLTNPLTVLLGASQTAGFYLPEQYCPDPGYFLPYRSEEAEVRRYLRLMEHLGIPTQGEALEFPLNQQDWQELRAIADTHPLQSNAYVCIHPGASVPSRRWSPQQFAAVGDALAEWGYQVVLTGSLSEIELIQAVATRMNAPALNLAGQTSLGALAALLQGARLLVCNDTGVSHLAAALQVPSVVIFTDSDHKRWAPLDRDRHRVVCATPDTPSQALTQAEELLQQEGCYVAS